MEGKIASLLVLGKAGTPGETGARYRGIRLGISRTVSVRRGWRKLAHLAGSLSLYFLLNDH